MLIKLSVGFILCLSALTTFGQINKTSLNNSGKPFTIGVTDQITSKQLGENRTINIYFPQDYNSTDTTQYAVIYLLDGGADEDFIHIAGLVQYNNFPWVNGIPKSIVVGIANTDRKRDFTYPTTLAADKDRYKTAGHSDKFISFIEKELQPYIEKKYKTSTSKTIIGESLGGLLATEILLKHPALFNKYIIVSPSLWWDNGSLLNQSPAITQKTDVYIGVGKEGLTPGDIPRVMEVDANTLADKLKSTKSNNLKVYFDYLPQENHATIIHQAVFNAFRLLYNSRVTDK